MNLLFTFCARAGSKGIKGKNAGDLAGLPLAYYIHYIIDDAIFIIISGKIFFTVLTGDHIFIFF